MHHKVVCGSYVTKTVLKTRRKHFLFVCLFFDLPGTWVAINMGSDCQLKTTEEDNRKDAAESPTTANKSSMDAAVEKNILSAFQPALSRFE